MSPRYYVHSGNKKHGPYSEEKIKELFSEKKISYKTHIWKEGLRIWVRVGDLQEFSNRVPVIPPELPSDPVENFSKTLKPPEDNWIIFDRKEKKGPFKKEYIIDLLKNKKIRSTTHAFRKGMKDWAELIYIDEFRDYFDSVSPDIEDFENFTDYFKQTEEELKTPEIPVIEKTRKILVPAKKKKHIFAIAVLITFIIFIALLFII